jgi:hypothetical protein
MEIRDMLTNLLTNETQLLALSWQWPNKNEKAAVSGGFL